MNPVCCGTPDRPGGADAAGHREELRPRHQGGGRAHRHPGRVPGPAGGVPQLRPAAAHARPAREVPGRGRGRQRPRHLREHPHAARPGLRRLRPSAEAGPQRSVGAYFFLPPLALPVARPVAALAGAFGRLALVAVALVAVALVALVLLVTRALLVAFAGALAAVSLGAVALPATTSLKPCPARNRGTLVALTLTGAPLRGLRAVRALRSCRSKVPKPTSATRSPFFTATCVCWIRLPSTLSTSARATEVCFWIASTSSLRFKGASLPNEGNSPLGPDPH